MVELIPLLVTVLVFLVPGLVFSFGFFSGTRFNKLDKVFAGLIFGLIAAPFLAYLEQLFFGISFSALIVLANSLVFLFIGLYLVFKKGLFDYTKALNVLKNEARQIEAKPVWLVGPILLVLIVLLGFYFRIAYSFISNFFEFDPYYYASLTEMLVTKGAVPLYSDLAYFPLTKFHHEPALVTFITGSWNALYLLFSGAVYSKSTLILITNIYPPLVGALLSVLVYWALKAQYHETAGIVGAALFASTPLLLQKFAAGVAELQPWGLFSAVFIFAAYLLALKYKDWHFTALAGFATVTAIVGAEQYLWPVGVVAAFFAVQSIVNYYSNHGDKEFVIASVVFSFSSVIGNVLLNWYAAVPLFNLSTVVLIAFLTCLPSVFFYYLDKLPRVSAYPRKLVLLGILFVGLAASLIPILPGGTSASGLGASFIKGAASFAGTGSPLGKTIAEETPTGSGDLPGVFGVLSPVLLAILAIFLAWSAIETLLIKRDYRLIVGIVAASLAIVFQRLEIANFAITFGTTVGLPLIAVLGELLAANQLFSFLVISIVSAIIAFIKSDPQHRSEVGLLLSFIVYPVAYIGLNKVKFLVHLSVALAFGSAVLIGEIINRARFIHAYFKVGDSVETPMRWTLGFAIIVGLLLTSVQAFGFPNRAPGILASVEGLGSSQISGDWLAAMDWLKTNTNFKNPAIQAQCKAKFGHDCRAISWWDYGHWIIFLGETKSVLDPGNSHPRFDQEVAYGFVDNQTAFKYSMDYHNASHVLVDYQLLEKWGALVFLSGSCQRYFENSTQVYGITCPEKRQIENWQKGAGGDLYEFDHYFENMAVQGQCPYSQSLVLINSAFGATYCASEQEIIPLDRNGLRTDLSRRYEIVNLRTKTENVDPNVHYLVPTSSNSFININPDLRVVGRESKVMNSTFARLYVFENLPGFKLVFRSPNGEVKLFEKVS